MAEPVPVTELSAFSSPHATPTAWSQVPDDLADAELYWLSTVRPDGRPHDTPLSGIWLEGRCTSARDQTNETRRTSRPTSLGSDDGAADSQRPRSGDRRNGARRERPCRARTRRRYLRVEVQTAFRRTGWNVVRPGRRHSAVRGSGLSRGARNRVWVQQGSQLQPNALELLTSTCPVSADLGPLIGRLEIIRPAANCRKSSVRGAWDVRETVRHGLSVRSARPPDPGNPTL
jgi:hypothetical protein